MVDIQDRPLAAKGLISYRYPCLYGGWVMIGAKNNEDALSEAKRSNEKYDDISLLQMFCDGRYRELDPQ